MHILDIRIILSFGVDVERFLDTHATNFLRLCSVSFVFCGFPLGGLAWENFRFGVARLGAAATIAGENKKDHNIQDIHISSLFALSSRFIRISILSGRCTRLYGTSINSLMRHASHAGQFQSLADIITRMSPAKVTDPTHTKISLSVVKSFTSSRAMIF